ncbi:flavin reductase [Derxia gummosa]|uniref:Flavin reductase n=1 Tax=Derxia gummosa DSM 723 TaxID=1121388 RepID=A0A8B6X3Z2_9BURK|nr:flavin reductase [Derxia gummosa]
MSDLTLEPRAFRDAMSRLAGAVNVITTDGAAGRAGLTATAVCSVSDAPPMLLVCVNRNSTSHDVFAANLTLCVNVLAHEQVALSGGFASRELGPDQRFALAGWTTLATGAPVLDGALASFDCVIDQVIPAGSHGVLLCAVRAVRLRADGEGLAYHDRAYHRLGAASRLAA